MEYKDYYRILGVDRGADQDAIKRAYRRMARKFHPDVSKEADAESKFKEVQEAYEVLKDPEKRTAYDRFGSDWKAGQDFRPPPDWQRDFSFGSGGYTESGDLGQFSEFFESLFGGRAARRPGGGGGRGRRAGFQARGQDVDARLAVSIEDAYAGATRTMTLNVPELDERGAARNRARTLNVKIPAGVRAGQRIRLAGQGGAGLGGAEAGDLYLKIEFEPHPRYRADGRDLVLALPVTPWEAALGRTVTVPTPGGRVELKIPAGSQTGRRLRLKGRGLPARPPGDLYVDLELVTPPADTAAAREFYEQMERELPMRPREKLDP